MNSSKKYLALLFLGCFSAFGDTVSFAQMPFEMGGKGRGGESSFEAMLMGEVVGNYGDRIVVMTSGDRKEVAVTSRTVFARENRVDKDVIKVGDDVLVIGETSPDGQIFPVMIRILERGGEKPRIQGQRDLGGPIFGRISLLEPLTVEDSSGGKKAIRFTDKTRILKETSVEPSQIKEGVRVRVLAPPRPGGMDKREALRIIIASDEAPFGNEPELSRSAGPLRKRLDASNTNGKTLLPDLPQQPLAPDFIYGAWLGRGLYSNEELERGFRLANNLGIRYLKMEFKWSFVEPTNNHYVWDNQGKVDVDKVVSLAKKYNLSIIPYFETFMPWGDTRRLNPEKGECEGPPSRFGQYQSPEPDEYAEYVFAVVDKLRKNGVDVRYIELDNEVANLNDGYGSRNCFINMSAKEVKMAENAAYDKVKKSYPDIKVSSTTFSFPGIGAGRSSILERDNSRRNSFIKAYFSEEPKPKFDFLALHEVLSGSGNPYTTIDKPESSGYEFNFASYNNAYNVWRKILDMYGYKNRPIINTESAAISRGIQDAELLQRVIFARVNGDKNGVKGWILSQLTGSRRFAEGGEEGISVGIAQLAEGYALKEGYYGFYTLISILANYPVYEGRIMGELNSSKPVVEWFSNSRGDTLYSAFIPYQMSAAVPQKVSLKIGPNSDVILTKSNTATTLARSDKEGYIDIEVTEHPVLIEVKKGLKR